MEVHLWTGQGANVMGDPHVDSKDTHIMEVHMWIQKDTLIMEVHSWIWPL